MTLEFRTIEKAIDYGEKLIINTELHFGATSFVSMNMARECPIIIHDMKKRNEQSIINDVMRAILKEDRGFAWLIGDLRDLATPPHWQKLEIIVDKLKQLTEGD